MYAELMVNGACDNITYAVQTHTTYRGLGDLGHTEEKYWAKLNATR